LTVLPPLPVPTQGESESGSFCRTTSCLSNARPLCPIDARMFAVEIGVRGSIAAPLELVGVFFQVFVPIPGLYDLSVWILLVRHFCQATRRDFPYASVISVFTFPPISPPLHIFLPSATVFLPPRQGTIDRHTSRRSLYPRSGKRLLFPCSFFF